MSAAAPEGGASTTTSQAGTQPGTQPAAPARRTVLSGRGELVVALLLLGVAGVLVYGNLTMDVVGDGGLLGPQGFAWLVAGLCAVLAALLARSAFAKPEPARTRDHATSADTNWRAVATTFGGMIAFTALLDVVGWLIMATALFATVATGLGNRNILRNVTVGFILASIVQITFSGMLGLALPSGILGRG
ncbi:tripartite tricarboxylate transporter TctB family protein [Nocardioides zeae]|uniref:Tripartite tricarboxylate transporter TctB family protein n=1 Tax=Nocardioides imazamoxiresistens TaxID=3231893 RepID=A0ABU3PQR8_9ACTN|nr:tripartite tricarboxylate transporter TctB family protein [Nocardioides zeae]MDT9591557.1 tripartite tricarboxylate transporter TctB family protein [Nocardioides zeae]